MSANASAGPGGFTFTPPAGWVDISRGAPEAQRAKATPALRAQADNPVITFMAMDPEHWDDGFVENMNVVVQTGKRALPSTPEVLAEVAKAAEAQAAKAGLTYRTTKMEVVKVAGVSAGRLEAELKSPAVATKLVQYVIPGEMSEAMLTFTTTPTNFARYAPLFDASAQATRGRRRATDPFDEGQRPARRDRRRHRRRGRGAAGRPLEAPAPARAAPATAAERARFRAWVGSRSRSSRRAAPRTRTVRASA